MRNIARAVLLMARMGRHGVEAALLRCLIRLIIYCINLLQMSKSVYHLPLIMQELRLIFCFLITSHILTTISLASDKSQSIPERNFIKSRLGAL